MFLFMGKWCKNLKELQVKECECFDRGGQSLLNWVFECLPSQRQLGILNWGQCFKLLFQINFGSLK